MKQHLTNVAILLGMISVLAASRHDRDLRDHQLVDRGDGGLILRVRRVLRFLGRVFGASACLCW